MFFDWLIHIGIKLFIICLSLKLFCLIYNVYVTCIAFVKLLFMFTAFVLIENYIHPLESFVVSKITVVRYIRIQEGQLRIHLVLNSTSYLCHFVEYYSRASVYSTEAPTIVSVSKKKKEKNYALKHLELLIVGLGDRTPCPLPISAFLFFKGVFILFENLFH